MAELLWWMGDGGMKCNEGYCIAWVRSRWQDFEDQDSLTNTTPKTFIPYRLGDAIV